MSNAKNERHIKYWEEMYSKLVLFKYKYGHCKVSLTNKEFPGLGKWVINARQRRKHGHITKDKIDRLDSLGFAWDARNDFHERQWNDKFERLKRYKRKKGDCMVPIAYKNDPQLGHFVMTQRYRYKNGTLRPDRKAKLRSIGFVWTVSPGSGRNKTMKEALVNTAVIDPMEAHRIRVERQWNTSFGKLVEFKRNHGHWRVPPSYVNDTSLASWIETQRNNRQSMKPDRVRRLNSIRFPWDPTDYAADVDNDLEADDDGAENETDHETTNETLDSSDNSGIPSSVEDRDASAHEPSGGTVGDTTAKYPNGTKVKKVDICFGTYV